MANDDPWEIPAFLLLSQAERNAAWKGRKLTNAHAAAEKAKKKTGWLYPQNMDPAGWALVRAAEAAKEAKKKQRLAALKQWKAENKR
jgi:hypothetical protein